MEQKMTNEQELIRVLDSLDQIKKLNNMIAMHQEGGNVLMYEQYHDMRLGFLQELKTLLAAYQITIELPDIAA